MCALGSAAGRCGVTGADPAVLVVPRLGGPGLSSVPHGQGSAIKRKWYLPTGRALPFFFLRILIEV